MNKAILIKAGLAVLMFAVFAAAAAPQSDKDKSFNGLGMDLGNLSRLSNAQTRSISPENFTGEKGKAGMSTDGPARARPATSARAGRSRPTSGSGRGDLRPGRHQGPGRDPADLDDAHRHLAPHHPAHLLGRRDRALGRMPRRRLLRLRLGPVRPGHLAARLRQSRQRLQLLLGDALPQALQDDHREHRRQAASRRGARPTSSRSTTRSTTR